MLLLPVYSAEQYERQRKGRAYTKQAPISTAYPQEFSAECVIKGTVSGLTRLS